MLYESGSLANALNAAVQISPALLVGGKNDAAIAGMSGQ
jgi:hypothetical protein